MYPRFVLNVCPMLCLRLGHYSFTVTVRSDSYLGLDVHEDIKLEVCEAKEAVTEHPQVHTFLIHFAIWLGIPLISGCWQSGQAIWEFTAVQSVDYLSFFQLYSHSGSWWIWFQLPSKRLHFINCCWNYKYVFLTNSTQNQAFLTFFHKLFSNSGVGGNLSFYENSLSFL